MKTLAASVTSCGRSVWMVLGVIALVNLSGCKRSTAAGQECDPSTSEACGAAQRIVSHTILTDEILWALGDDVRRRVVAVSPLADDPTYSGVAGRWPAEIPRLGGRGEHLIAMSPDLVLIASITSAELKALLKQTHIPFVLLDKMRGFEDYRQNITRVAEAVGARAEGRSLVKAFDTRLGTLRRRVSKKDRPTVTSWSSGLVAGAATTFHDAASAAGLDNVAASKGIAGHRTIGLEQLLSWDPTYVVIGCKPSQCQHAAQQFRQQLGMSVLRATQSNGIVAVPRPILLSTGDGMLDLVEILIRHRQPAESPE